MYSQLEKLNSIIKECYSINNPSGEQLNTWMLDMSSILFYLTTEQVKYHKEWTALMYDRTESSVAAQKIKADHEIPELYMLRKIINAGYKELDVMRSSLSYLKSERNSTHA